MWLLRGHERRGPSYVATEGAMEVEESRGSILCGY